MAITDSTVLTEMRIYVDDSSHNSPSYVYAKQFDTNSRFIKVFLMNSYGQYDIDTAVQLNATRPDGIRIYIEGTRNSDGSATFELTTNLIAVQGVVTCDISLFEDIPNEDPNEESTSIILTSSNFFVVVDKSNYDAEAIEGTADWSAVAQALQELSDAQGAIDTAKDTAVQAASDAQGYAGDASDAATAAVAAKEAAEDYAEALLQQNITFALTQSGHMTVEITSPT